MTSKLFALVLLVAGMSAAQAQIYITGNDTGGMIVWTPANERLAFVAAEAHCAGYGKLARVTSVYRQYGHYIGFACAFPRGHVLREREFAIRTKG